MLPPTPSITQSTVERYFISQGWQLFRLWFQIGIPPGDIPAHAVMDVTRPREQVKLTGIDDQLCGHPQRAQCLVHLLATPDGNVEVRLSSHEQRRCMYPVRVKEG